ncbi:MAG: lectin-like protein, partial [Ilumatobacteraceae bacterium]
MSRATVSGLRRVWRRLVLVLCLVVSALALGLPSTPAVVAAGETVTAPSNIRLRPNVADQDPGDFVINGFSGSATLLVSVGFINPPTGTSFRFTQTTGLTAGHNYSFSSGLQKISFTGTQANANAALASMLVTTGITQGAVTINVSATLSQTNVYYNPINDHFYEYVPSYNITWTNALNLADDRTVSGDTGYLVTITNADENNFIKTYINAQKIWIAAADDQVEGDWRWRAGPESGQTFWKAGCDSSTNYCTGLYTDSTPLVNTYSSWASGEPNNWDGNEGYAVTNWNAAGDGLWNDLVYNSSGGVN